MFFLFVRLIIASTDFEDKLWKHKYEMDESESFYGLLSFFLILYISRSPEWWIGSWRWVWDIDDIPALDTYTIKIPYIL